MADQHTKYADKAAGYMNEAERLSGTHEGRKLDALRGIGWAILALGEQLAGQGAGLAEAVAAVADQIGDLAVPADRLADAAQALSPRPRRWFRRRHPDVVISVTDGKSTGAGARTGGAL
jgi:hypothetical protein